MTAAGPIAGAGAALWLAIAALALWWPEAPHAPVRLLAALLGVTALAAPVVAGRPRLLLSPLLLLGAIAVVFYSLGPALMAAGWGETAGRFLKPFVLGQLGRYLDGRGELFVLMFAVLCLVAWAVSVRVGLVPGAGAAADVRLDGRPARTAALSAAAIVLAAAAFLVAARLFPAGAAFLNEGAGRELGFAMAPLVSLGLATLAWVAAARGGRWGALAVAAAVVGAAGLMSTYAAKTAVFATVAALLLYVVRRAPAPAWIALAGTSAIAIFLGISIVVSAIRAPIAGRDVSLWSTAGLQAVGRSLVFKGLARQAETAACFQTVLDRHLAPAGEESPFYFLVALVPRALWPQKPNLSLGHEYGFAYCGMEPPKYAPRDSQSYSITLIGEPVVRAGLAGLSVAVLVVITGLGTATALAHRGGAPGMIALAAMLPWLVDFDQSFALYVGNAVKMFAIMAPLVLALVLLRFYKTGLPEQT